MLMKLMKHEFRATGRIMGLVYLLLLAASLGANLSFRVFLDSSHTVLNLLGGILMMAFVFAIIAVFLVAFLLMVQRFYKNLLQDEGYVMLTLPVSIHQHIWTKLTVSAVWFAATFLAVFLASLLSIADVGSVGRFFEGLWELLRDVFHMRPADVTNILIICVELVVLAFVTCCSMCLQIYASLAIGHSAASHKLGWSIGAYLIISFALQLVGGLLMIFANELELWRLIPSSWHLDLEMYAGIHLGLWMLILLAAVQGIIFYPVTVWFMKHRLNLE